MTETFTLEKPITALAITLNEAIKTQDKSAPLTIHDLCDRCPQTAQSTFTYAKGQMQLCGHHMRLNLESILSGNVASFWINPAELHHLRGISIPGQDFKKSGDGLTDS